MFILVVELNLAISLERGQRGGGGGGGNQDPGDPGVGKVRGGKGFFSFKQGGN